METEIAKIISTLLNGGIVCAGILSLWYSLVLLVVAFKQSIWWGLGYLIVPCVSIFFVIAHWEVAKSPFLKSILTVLTFYGIIMLGEYLDLELWLKMDDMLDN